MDTPDDFTGPVNLGNPGEFTIRELAEKILEMTGSRSELVFKPLPIDDPRQRQPDITLTRERLGWEPKIKLADGLVQTFEFFECRCIRCHAKWYASGCSVKHYDF